MSIHKTESFTNAVMRQPVKGKPHIALIAGFWRVSPLPLSHSLGRRQRLRLWDAAHRFTLSKNNARRTQADGLFTSRCWELEA